MPREEPVRVPIDEIRRMLEELDRRRTRNGAGGRSGPPHSIIPSSLAYQNTHQPRQELVRVPLDEVQHTLEDLDRRHARGRTPRRHGESQQTGAKPREEPVRIPLNERAKDRGHRLQAVARRNTITVPEDELRRIIAAITQQHAEERLRARAARLRAEEEAGKLDRQGAEGAPQTQPPATPERIVRAPQILPPSNRPRDQPPPPRRAIPHTPPPRKRLREPQPEGLLTPPPTRPDRPRKRPRPSQETALLQQESLETILQYHKSRFRDKERESVARSWCKEVPLALQRRHLTPSLLQATAALQEYRDCFPAGNDAEAMVCHECYAALKKGKQPKTCAVNNIYIGCEHRYPEELDGLSPVEERLIALQASFGYITKFTINNKTPSGLSYRKHIKGHIVVFPNKVEDLVATVLPHPLLVTIKNIHVSWSGSSKPGDADVGHLLQVHKSRIRAVLL
ncbi:hypothetical protein BGZ61DRAFT_593621 [Ilyonectria robusta]|uniref:uncharacterized protein n=1 Tax=Ilyonectria robusta TaxID=1079257 RepID=UPI001E8D2FEB|nr:uncharacterized protein BGZ61DRAFT_593621 [Ilyonectria robusta]KAH8661806.1 hypothetical protein BGZ61DRAFT_593621 [Ilyonectria robusta]